ncbi:pectin lyase-like protein [Thozetella sp. PMI_491]|nr:pectin lyase-like protein [Thozetella sp. PMI_491]
MNLLRATLVFWCLAEGSPLLSTASSADIAAARAIVADAQAKSAVLNKARLANPARNTYSLAPGTIVGDAKIGRKRSAEGGSSSAPPLLQITPEIAAAAALVAEADAAASSGNVSAAIAERAGGVPFWMESIPRMGSSPWGTDSSYKIFRNVKDYGAKGDGLADDTQAIINAMTDGNRCGANCNGESIKNAIVYFPGGIYLVSSTITANNKPTIKASSSFVGLGVLSTDTYVGDGLGIDGKDDEWYVNTASFYRQIRNVRIDVTSTPPNNFVCAIHYQVAQATSLQNLELVATSGTTQQGMYSENGSGGFMSDVTFTGGAFGFYGGNQQFTVRNLVFNGCDTAVQIIWDWAWIWKDIIVQNSKVGFKLDPDGGTGVIGSITIMDATFTNVKQAILMDPPQNATKSGTTGIVLENVLFQSVPQPVSDTSGKTWLASSGGSLSLVKWIQGPIYFGLDDRRYLDGTQPVDRVATLLSPFSNGLPMAPYFGRSKPQYETTPVSSFVNLKTQGAKGDGVTDDTAALQNAFNKYAGTGTIIFADAGVYMITDTVFIPPGTKLVGEAWTQFAATGSKFQDQTNPRVMLRVGNDGDTGSVEMQDIIFTTKGPTPGAVLVEWNILADAQGSAGIWDCHARLGGATGTSLTPAECPALTDGTTKSACMTANLVMHLTTNSSGYFENMWLWTADHMIDDPNLSDGKNPMVQLSVFTARGMLIESQAATWLYGTASEHAVMYQYNFYQASNIYAGLLQTESPYYQPSPKAPAPFASNVGLYYSDPTYDCSTKLGGCDSSWSLYMSGCTDVRVGALGAYSWFDTYSQDCVDLQACQNALVWLDDNSIGIMLEQIITIGANVSMVVDGGVIEATDNLALAGHPAWSQISYMIPESNSVADTIDDGPDDVESPCDWSLAGTYGTLEDVQNDLDNVGAYCAGIYAVGVMVDMLAVALSKWVPLILSPKKNERFAYMIL